MIDDSSARSENTLDETFERYLQDKGKGRGGDGTGGTPLANLSGDPVRPSTTGTNRFDSSSRISTASGRRP
ncbi:hypothetical protein HYG81_19250 (plasmid) [Natrinema zhouii]|nr:hypothetical protein [Natrinema zhouii]UHQ98225.1 hypothetical protein HYG81_19250 [Natrinema zhouii]